MHLRQALRVVRAKTLPTVRNGLAKVVRVLGNERNRTKYGDLQ